MRRHLIFVLVVIWGSPLWGAFLQDYSQAVIEKKPLLLFFHGSDWSGLSMKMKKEVLQSPEFAKAIDGQILCVELDFPKHHVVNETYLTRAKILRERYQIEELPALVLLDAEGELVAKLGYLPEEGERLGSHLLTLLTQNERLKELTSRIETLEGEALKEGYLLALELQQKGRAEEFLRAGMHSRAPAFFLLEKYRALLTTSGDHEEEIFETKKRLQQLDPENREGTLFTLAVTEFQALSTLGLSPEEVIFPIQEYVEHFGESDLENRWRIEMMMAQFYLEHNEGELATHHAEIALQMAPLEKKEEVGHSHDVICKIAAEDPL